jgi:Flp pilus assembly pilin Flp
MNIIRRIQADMRGVTVLEYGMIAILMEVVAIT